jgi:DivIVA domain-containing protein
MTGGLTANGDRETRFGKPPSGKRGYNDDEVDAFLEVAEATLGELDRLA